MTHACPSPERLPKLYRTAITLAITAVAVMSPLPAPCAQIIDASDGATLYVKVSKREITRIALASGRIATLRFRVGELTVEQDDDTGQLFVSVPDGIDKPVNAFLTTTDGHTYTLLIQPVDIPGDSVIVRQPGSASRQTASMQATTYVREQQRLLTALAADTIPHGAELREVATPYRLWNDFHMTLQRLLVSDALVGERYLLTNQGPDETVLEEREFYRPGVNAIGLDRLMLGPGDSTALYVVRERKSDD